MAGKVYLSTTLAGPQGVLQPGYYDATTLAQHGYPLRETTTVAPPARPLFPPLTAISGIGPATAAALTTAGVQDLAGLLAEDAARLAALLDLRGVGAQTVEGWQKSAAELAAEQE